MKKILIFCFSLFLFTETIYATEGNGIIGGKMTGGIGNVSIYIDNQTHPYATYYQRLIKNAVSNWDNTGYGTNDFNYVYVGSNRGSKIDIYNKYGDYFGEEKNKIYALTYFLTASETIIEKPTTTNWYSATIELNDYKLSQDSVSNQVATGTFAHEIGHAFGLDHRLIKKSIMAQVWLRTVQKVQKIDNDTLNNIY